MDLSNLSFDDLLELKNRVDNMIYSYEDGYVYICRVRSYGRNWTENVTNVQKLKELCYQYDGQDGIVDVYSTNPNLGGTYNYGDLMYIESVEDYDKWYKHKMLVNLIRDIKFELDKWENRDNLPFTQRPHFSPCHTPEDLVEFERELSEYDMSFVPPRPYSTVEDED
jgi:hypothetical protein